MTDIRVGLESLYAEVSEITIKNTKLGLGYCIKDNYKIDVEFESSSGFRFSAADGYYYILTKTFASYKSAAGAAGVIRNLGVNAWPVAIYRNYWRVYVGGVTQESEALKVYEQIRGRYGYTYSELTKNNKQRLLVSANSYSFLIDGEKKGAYPQFKALLPDAKGNLVLNLGSRSYRGRIEIGCYGKSSVTAVNVIQVDSYLYGVVPCEMQSNYEMEALKAQAVCARSFALTRVGYRADSNISKAYYLGDTTKYQVYRGYTAETARTAQAVDATAGMVLKYKGKTVPAYYFSTSGGSTESVSEVWGFSSDYLTAMPDLYETEPEKKPWLSVFTKEQLSSKLASYKQNIGNLLSIVPQVTTMTGRVYSLKIKGTKGSAILQTGTIREALSLYSTKFKVVTKGDVPDLVSVRSDSEIAQAQIQNCYIISAGGTIEKASKDLDQYIVAGESNFVNYPRNAPKNSDTWYFYGMGYGHGVGMSQSGANGMAKAGYTYKEILAYYFQGCTCGV